MITGHEQLAPIHRLPSEVLDAIIADLRTDYIDLYPGIGYLATVCRQWQPVVERHSFKAINLRSVELDRFREIFLASRAPHRKACLQRIYFEVILPTYSVQACGKFERARDRRANNEAFTDAIRRLFGILRFWDVGDTSSQRHSIHLDLEVSSPMDQYNREDPALHGGAIPEQPEHSADLLNMRFVHSYLQFMGLEQKYLPKVASITSMRVIRWQRRLTGATMATMAAALPNLQQVFWVLSDNEWRYPALRQQHRYEFAKGLDSLSLHLPKLRSLQLTYFMNEPIDHGCRIHSALHPSSPGRDHLSRALRTLSQSPTITNLGINACISAELFWPADSDNADTPSWPSLQRLKVIACQIAPDGRWYLSRTSDEYTFESRLVSEREDFPSEWGDLSDYDDDDDQESIGSSQPDDRQDDREMWLAGHAQYNPFRARICRETFNPVIFAFARAVLRMPSLKYFSFRMNEIHTFYAEWARAGSSCTLEEDRKADEPNNRNRWTLVSDEAADWEVPEGLMEILQEGVGHSGLVTVKTARILGDIPDWGAQCRLTPFYPEKRAM
ncbi:hypothetical protein BDZ91DRAFT_784541 [Kalaharituber pfeilii]|nr:hypothetical protein BDZ91DRAFT_784541 [Kalaharituber pfeilii]